MSQEPEKNSKNKTLHANFLKSHPNFELLSVEEMFATLEEFVGQEIKRV